MARKYMERYNIIIPGLRIANVSGPGRTKGVSAWQGRCIDNLAIVVNLPQFRLDGTRNY